MYAPARNAEVAVITIAEIEANGGFPVIYADPPWAYADRGCNGAAEKQYSTMTLAEICALPVARIAAKDAVLFIWGTYPMLREVLQVIEAWGFTYKSIAFQWLKTYEKSGKPFFGLGRWTRGNTEPCFLAVRGKPHRIAADVSQLILTEEILVAPVGRHSAKPKEAIGKIERLMGRDTPSIELFARECPPNWECWGNQVASTVALAEPKTAEKMWGSDAGPSMADDDFMRCNEDFEGDGYEP